MASLTTLPVELLVEILLYFDYVQLVKLRRVSRKFNKVLTASSGTGALSKVLFRHKEDPNTPVDEEKRYCFVLHPAIHLLVAKYQISSRYTHGFPGSTSKRLEIVDVGLRNKASTKFASIKNTAVANEQAFAQGVPAEEFLPIVKSSKQTTPFGLSFGGRNEGLTVQQFAINLKGFIDWIPYDGECCCGHHDWHKHHLLQYIDPDEKKGFSDLLRMRYLNAIQVQHDLGYRLVFFCPEKDVFAVKGYGSDFYRNFKVVYYVDDLPEVKEEEEDED